MVPAPIPKPGWIILIRQYRSAIVRGIWDFADRRPQAK